MHDCELILNVKKQWTPVQDEMLILKRKPTNVVDRNAVAVFREDQVVGHVQLAPSILLFLRRDINKTFAKVVGEKVNREASMHATSSTHETSRRYVLEVACMELVDSFWAYI